MPSGVPESGDPQALLGPALDALLELTGAACGWVGLPDAAGRLTFPARRGPVPEAWLALQQGRDGAWGFEVREGPTLLNDLSAWPVPGDAPLSNLLSCPLPAGGPRPGQLVLANKAAGFTSQDAVVLQGAAQVLARQLAAPPGPAEPVPQALLRASLDRCREGVLVIDDAGTLVLANAAWGEWTGFPAAELAGRPAPFPFWVSHRDLAALGRPPGPTAALPDRPPGAFPFRRRNDAIFWCHVETFAHDVDGRRLTVAVLRPLPAEPAAVPRRDLLPSVAEHLPFALLLLDRKGRVQWANRHLARLLGAGEALAGPSEAGGMLREHLALESAAALEQLVRDPASGEPGRFGRLLLAPQGRGPAQALVAYWLAVPLADGPGYLLAVSDDWEGLCPPDDLAAEWRRAFGRPPAEALALLLRPGGPIGWWDERWHALTGLTAADLAGVPSDVVLDWLFPEQCDRDFIADQFHQPGRKGTQSVLRLVTRSGSRPMLCTLLAVPAAEAPAGREGAESWLLLVSEPRPFAGTPLEDTPPTRFVRQFARGLSHLLNSYLMAPIGLAEMALDRPDLPPDLSGWFAQILDSCQRATYLVSALQDLAAVTAGETQVMPLSDLVREVLDAPAAERPERPFELAVEVRDAAALVRVNRRMITVVLGHLLSNAEQALLQADRPRVEVRVFAQDESVCCEVQDNGEGLPTPDWAATLAPFYSTKGPFAKDAAHAALRATGLGLTVSHHLLALHGGRLELHSRPGQGTTALLSLPRADRLAGARPAVSVAERTEAASS